MQRRRGRYPAPRQTGKKVANGMSGALAGKVALVTGAGSAGTGIGNGRGCAIRLAEHGARVALFDVTDSVEETCEIITHEGGTSAVFRCDVTNDSEVEAAVTAVREMWGSVDILVNNVGIAGPPGSVVDVDLDGWRRCWDLNVTSMVIVSRHVIPLMAAAGGGSIVNMSSIVGLRGGHAAIGYAATKGAIVNLTQSMAVHHGGDGIRVNAIAPGLIQTPMVATAGITGALREERAAANLLGIEGTAWDVADAVLFLAGPQSRFITGVVLPIDGGLSAYAPATANSITDVGATKAVRGNNRTTS
jgi:NAD(P)-dependent dehydrogenase (short-subunit alcohol dehydrogenase family)